MSPRPSDIVLRPARAEDDPALCDLFARITMEADLELAVDRSPSFFGLYRAQRLLAEHVVTGALRGEDGEVSPAAPLEGVATFLAREGYLEGTRRPVGYLGDLRLGPRVRGGFFLGRVYGPLLREWFAAAGVEVATTAVIRSNEAAMRILAKRSKRLPHKPVYRPWRSFTILNVHFTRRRRPRPTALEVRRATPADLPTLAAFLDADQRARPFGYPFDDGLLEWRLAHWPGLRLEDFFLCFRGGRLVGVTACWDAAAVKRFRVQAYRGSMVWVRRAFNLGAFLLRYPPLPPVGEVMRYAYLTHVAVEGDDPLVMQALVDRIYADQRAAGHHFVCACVLDGDPLGVAYERYQTTPIPAQLFTVSLPGSRYEDWDPGPGRPGFEMALV